MTSHLCWLLSSSRGYTEPTINPSWATICQACLPVYIQREPQISEHTEALNPILSASHQAGMSDHNPSRLLNLPSELRCRIYSFLNVVEDQPLFTHLLTRKPRASKIYRLMREEVLNIIYCRNRFVVSNQLGLQNALTSIGPVNIYRIRCLRLGNQIRSYADRQQWHLRIVMEFVCPHSNRSFKVVLQPSIDGDVSSALRSLFNADVDLLSVEPGFNLQLKSAIRVDNQPAPVHRVEDHEANCKGGASSHSGQSARRCAVTGREVAHWTCTELISCFSRCDQLAHEHSWNHSWTLLPLLVRR